MGANLENSGTVTVEDIKKAQVEYTLALKKFNDTTGELIDHASHEISSTRSWYDFLLKKYKEQNPQN